MSRKDNEKSELGKFDTYRAYWKQVGRMETASNLFDELVSMECRTKTERDIDEAKFEVVERWDLSHIENIWEIWDEENNVKISFIDMHTLYMVLNIER